MEEPIGASLTGSKTNGFPAKLTEPTMSSIPAWIAVLRGAAGLELVNALALAARARRAAAVFMVLYFDSSKLENAILDSISHA